MSMRSTVSKLIGAALSGIALSGCAARYGLLAQAPGFERSFISAGRFTLTSYSRFSKPGEPVRVYIEGDGRAWVSRTRLSDNPTPAEPLVMELAARDPAANVAYIARPGQYTATGAPGCDASYWDNRRFSEEVIAAVNSAVDAVLKRSGSDKIELVGYSGGGAVAVLVAARRGDIISLRTLAGNLDPEAVNKYHKVSPLEGSLNPMDYAEKIKDIPQRHFVGSKDKVVPPFVARSFSEREGDGGQERITVVEGAAHSKGWLENWERLLSVPVSAGGSK